MADGSFGNIARHVDEGTPTALAASGERILAGLLSLKRRPLWALTLVLGLIALATVIRVAVSPLVSGTEFATFFLAVVVGTFVGGVRIGLAAMAISTLAAWFFVVTPTLSLESDDVFALLMFVFTAGATVFTIDVLQRAAVAEHRHRALLLEEQGRTAEELHRWRDIFNNIAVGVTTGDPNYFTIRFANEAFAALHGMKVDEITGISVFDLFPPAERERISAMTALADRTGHASFEASRRRKDGSSFPARTWLTSVRGSDGKMVYRIATVTDLTAERERETRWVDVIQNAAFGLNLTDPKDNLITLSNKALADMHGMSLGELDGRSLFDFYADGDKGRIAAALEDANSKGAVVFEADRRRKDGSTFPARMHVSTVRGADGEVRYRIVSTFDISAQRALERELQQRQRLEAIGQLTAGVAHDFNNLLQGIMANLELLDDEVRDRPAARQFLASVLRIADRGGELTRHLLSFSRQQVLRPAALDLASFFDEFHRSAARILDPLITVTIAVEPGLPPVWIDATHLHTALLNLAINARDAMPSGGDLPFEARCSGGAGEPGAGGFAVIRVVDSGTGIPPEILGRVCEPFFTTKGAHGTGLGLSMVYGFAEQSGGDLRITSEPAKGTCVELRLPFAPVSAIR